MKILYTEFIPEKCVENANEVDLPTEEETDIYVDEFASDMSTRIQRGDNISVIDRKLNENLREFANSEFDEVDDNIIFHGGTAIPTLAIDKNASTYTIDFLGNYIQDNLGEGITIISKRIGGLQHGRHSITNIENYCINIDDTWGACYAPMDDVPMKFIFNPRRVTIKAGKYTPPTGPEVVDIPDEYNAEDLPEDDDDDYTIEEEEVEEKVRTISRNAH